MKARFFVSLGAIAAGGQGNAQEVVEPADFNITNALIANGVDASVIPDITSASDNRSLFEPCATAVGPIRTIVLTPVLTPK